jgi:hypothetical protein
VGRREEEATGWEEEVAGEGRSWARGMRGMEAGMLVGREI